MLEMGAVLISTQAMAAPEDLLNLALNARAVAPEGMVLLSMLGTLIVDLAGEKSAAKWSPPIWGIPEAIDLLKQSFNQDNNIFSYQTEVASDNLISIFRE